MTSPRIELDDTLRAHVRLECIIFSAVSVREGDPRLVAQIEAAALDARTRYGGLDVASLPGVSDVRALYRATGTDPTKRRPSSEALLRRALRGQPLPLVNTLVDCINLFSLSQLVPVGLYDLAKIDGPIQCRRGRALEPYDAIGREEFNVAGRMVLADRIGPFGSPTSDSTRTMVTLETVEALAVIFWPPRRAGASSRTLLDYVEGYCLSTPK